MGGERGEERGRSGFEPASSCDAPAEPDGAVTPSFWEGSPSGRPEDGPLSAAGRPHQPPTDNDVASPPRRDGTVAGPPLTEGCPGRSGLAACTSPVNGGPYSAASVPSPAGIGAVFRAVVPSSPLFPLTGTESRAEEREHPTGGDELLSDDRIGMSRC